MPTLEAVEAYICPMTGLIVTPTEIDGITASCFKCPYDGGWDGGQKCGYERLTSKFNRSATHS